jgi:hypothetical protein
MDLGGFSQESIDKLNDLFDFARCQRPDGTHYGSRGRCLLGTEVGAREDDPKGFRRYMEENSFSMPGRSFGGAEIGEMLNQAAQLEGEAGENIRRLQDFIMNDKIVVAVSETLNSVAERTGAKGVRELNKKDVPWSLTKEHIEFLKKGGVPEEVFDRIRNAEERLKLNKSREEAQKKKADEEKKANAEWGFGATVQQEMLKNMRKQMREDKALLNDVPRRLSSFTLAGDSDGHTQPYNRIVVITDDKNQLHSPFDKSKGANPQAVQENWGRIMETRANMVNLTSKSEKFDATVSTSVSHAGEGLTRNDRVMAVYIHEVGHQVYFRAGSPEPPTNSPTMSRTVGRGITEYATTNKDELFAESLSAYMLNPRALKQQDEPLYNWVKSTMETAEAKAGAELL